MQLLQKLYPAEVESSREGGAHDFVSARTPSNWCKGSSFPTEIEPILRALFGPATSPSYRRADAYALRKAYQTARDDKYAAVFARTKPNPAGEKWVARDEQLVIERTTRLTDKRAALDPLRQQLQGAIAHLAAELVEPARRLSNSRTWGRLARTAEAFHTIVYGDPREMPERLGIAYALLLRLGGFLETDISIQISMAC